MLTYQYKARDKFGKLVTGIMGAESEKAVAVKLGQMGYTPIGIAETKGEFKVEKVLSGGGQKKIKFSDLNLFTRQLFTLQKAGLPLLTSLNALREQTSDIYFKEVISQIGRHIEGGSDFSTSLGHHPQIFNPIYVNMIKSGEMAGKLSEILERLAVLGEHEERIRMRIQAATRYPIIVITALGLGFLVLITFVVPRFTKLYSEHQTSLPIPTQILIAVNYTVVHFWWAFLIAGIFLFIFFKKLLQTQEGLFWWDSIKLKVPVFGPLLLHIVMSRFCRVTGTMIQSGIPILQILDLVKQGVGNSVVSRTISNIRDGVNEGRGMSEPMKASKLYPPIVVQMVAVGENTGKTDDLLLHVADYYDSQVDFTINNLVSLIEPFLILILGVGVLFMALGIFMPMWGMMRLFVK